MSAAFTTIPEGGKRTQGKRAPIFLHRTRRMASEGYRARVHKFSSKPPGHDAARQRENQRRHRARVKSRISELEAALSDTQNKLDDALRQINTLAAEVQRLHALGSEASTPQRHGFVSHDSDLAHINTDHTSQQETPEPNSSSRPETEDATDAATPTETARPTSPDIIVPDGQGALSTGTPIRAVFQEVTIPISDLENANHDCPLLPAPSAGESTIPCRDAYSIIKERSSPEFDLSAANEWLKPGFRRAIVPGTGCRVQTHILFAFVDHITPI
jgi:hypothetical protein